MTGDSGKGRAAAWLFLAVLGFSLLPVTIAWGRGADSPFLFNAVWRAGVVICCLGYFLIWHRRLFVNGPAFALVIRRIPSRWILLSVIGNLGNLPFILAIRYVDPAVLAVLYELWAVFFVVYLSWLFRGQGRYRRLGFIALLSLLLAAGGSALAVASQQGDLGLLARPWDAGSNLLVGAALGLLTPATIALAAFGFRWGTERTAETPAQTLEDTGGEKAAEAFFVVWALTLGSIGAGVVSLAIGAGAGESLSLWQFNASLVGGVFVTGIAVIGVRRANLATTDLSVNALAYLTGPLALLWLFTAGLSDIAWPALLVGGLALIISGNALMAFGPAFGRRLSSLLGRPAEGPG